MFGIVRVLPEPRDVARYSQGGYTTPFLATPRPRNLQEKASHLAHSPFKIALSKMGVTPSVYFRGEQVGSATQAPDFSVKAATELAEIQQGFD